MRRYARPGVPVLFSAYEYGAPKPLTAAARAQVLLPPAARWRCLRALRSRGRCGRTCWRRATSWRPTTPLPTTTLSPLADLAAVRAGGPPGQVIFTTEKDATRLQAPALAAALASLPVYTIPVRVALLADGAARLAAAVAAATGPAGR
ncbi:MAG: hypothetical protein WKG07_16845 [Hymenobacter sp.]